jgi:hypothetical protein
MSSFSGWGPTDDGRIKPDLVGNGVLLWSPASDDTDSNGVYDNYYGSSGTSMSAPNVTGGLGLMIDHYRDLNGGADMRSATLKGLALHTTKESGSNPGPDYAFGWGLLDVEAAAAVITDDSTNDFAIQELSINTGGSYTEELAYTGSGVIRATICWTDPAGPAPGAQNDPPTLMLVNDLDIRITKDAVTYEPWVLDPANPANAATTGDNFRDNVEQILIAVPESGDYTISVTHKGATLDSGSQAFSLIITGLEELSGPVFQSFEITPDEITHTQTTTGTVTIDRPAEAGGFTFTCVTSYPLDVPTSVTIPEGDTSADFTITPTTGPISSTSVYSVSIRVDNVHQGSDTVAVTPVLLDIAEFQGDPDEVTGGLIATLDLTLNGPAPAGGLEMSFESTNLFGAPHPDPVTIPAGDTTISVPVLTIVQLYDSEVRIIASHSVAGVWTRAQSDKTALLPHEIELVLSPDGIVSTGTTTGEITLGSPAPAGGMKLYPRTGTGISMPEFVIVPEGSTTASFVVTPTLGLVTSTKVYRIRLVKKVGLIHATVCDDYLYLKPLLIMSVNLTPSTVTGGNTSVFRVSMNGPAPAGGYVVDLTSGNPAVATVPATATVPAGADYVDTTVTTFAVGGPTFARIYGQQTIPGWSARGYSQRLYVNP